jgi:pimeloyl-ACP methyl ester carboxylesterase
MAAIIILRASPRHIHARHRRRVLPASIHVPVLLIHGDADIDTPPDHSRRIFAALNGPKRLILVPGGTHNSALRPEVWREIDQWIDRVLSTPLPSSPSGRAG